MGALLKSTIVILFFNVMASGGLYSSIYVKLERGELRGGRE